MKYYYREHLAGYQRMKTEGKRSWGEIHGHPDDLVSFSSKPFLECVLSRLRILCDHPMALELGCGTGPGACFLAGRGFRVTGIDLIPAAIEVAREIARERHLDVQYEVMDVTQMPHDGARYDLIVDSYCLQGIVLDSDRGKGFSAVRARLNPSGYYLISTAMYEETRHHPEDQIADPQSGAVFHRVDDHDIFDPETEIFYELFPGTMLTELVESPEDYEETVEIAGKWYLPKRRYRTPESLRGELERAGFSVLLQTGKLGQNVACALAGAPATLD